MSTAFTLEQLRILNEAITTADEVEQGRIEAANAILAIRGHNITIQRHEDALTVLRQLEEELMECGDYRYAATFLLGAHLFNAEPDFVKRVFGALHGKHDLLLIQGSTSSSKTYSCAAWHYIDWRRWPEGTTIKVAALSEEHLRKNVFAHISDFHKAAQEVLPMSAKVRETDLFLGLEEAGDAVGFSGVAFQKGNLGTGHFKGYKSKPTRHKHKTLGDYTRLRILGDECVRGDQCVTMPDFSERPIKDLVDEKYSGEVWSYNISSKKTELKRVTGWHKVPLRKRKLVSVGGLIVTEDHPIYCPDHDSYMEAKEFEHGWLDCIRLGVGSRTFTEAAEFRDDGYGSPQFVYCIDVEDNHNFFCEGIATHNCQQWGAGPFSDFGSTLASIRAGGTIKASLCFNPDATSRPVVVMAEPEQGWVAEEIDTLYEWESKRGWHVIRLDASRLENVAQRREIYRGFQTYEGYMAIMKESGDNGEKYAWACRGFPPVKGSSSCIIPPAWATECRGEATFLPGIETLVTTDMSYAGIDKATMSIWRWGKALGWRRADGQFVTFRHRQTQKEQPRYVLQLDQIIYLEKADQTIMAAEEIMGKCKDLGVEPQNVAIDSTGAGLGTASHLRMYWGDVLAVNWGEAATEGKILSEDVRTAKEQYDGLISEMWFTCRRWMDPTVGVLLINPIVPSHPLNTQLTTRRYKWAKEGRQRVEKKDEWKARHQGLSPDEADSFVMGPLLVRQRKNILPGLVEQQGSEGTKDSGQFTKLESVDNDEQLDGYGGGEEHLSET